MNNRVLMSIIAVIITILLAVLLIWGASSCDARSNPVYIEGEDHFETEPEGETSENSSSIYGIEDSIFDDLEEGELIDDFEGSDKPSGNGSGGNNPASSSSSSSAQNNGSSSGSSSSRPSSGSTSSRPSSNGGSGSSSESSSSGFDPESEPNSLLTYEEYLALSSDKQMEYMYSFPSMDDYLAWLSAVQIEYENREEIKVNGSVDLGDYINP